MRNTEDAIEVGSVGVMRRAGEWMTSAGTRAAACAAIAVLGYMIARLTVRFDPYYAVAAAICLAFGVAVAYKPEFGILTYLSIAPFAFGGSPEVESQNSDYGAGLLPCELLLVFLLIIWFGRMLVSERLRLAPSPLNKPLIALGSVVLLSLACSQFIYDNEVQHAHRLLITQIAEAGLLMLAIGAFFVAANSLRDAAWLQATIYPVAIIGVYVIIFKLSKMPMFVYTPKATLVVTVVGAYTLSRLLFARQSAAAAFCLGVIFLGCVAVTFSSLSWVSGLAAFSLMLMTLVFLRSRKAFATIVAVGAVAIVLLWSVAVGVYNDSRAQGDFDRLGIALDSANMALHTNPILGIGPGNFYAYSFKYGTIWYGLTTYTTAHSNYSQAIAELGLAGILVLLWLVFAGIRTGLTAFKETRADMKWVPAAATAIFVGFAVSSVMGDYLFPNRANGGILNFGITVYVWLTMGLAVAAQRISARDSAP